MHPNSMQLMLRSSAIVAFLTGAGAVAIQYRSRDTIDAIRYGPSSCILISRSSTGSCVITTDCQGVDTSQTEFGFSCVLDGEDTQWHSYGNGGFEANEEFDSGMKCDQCSGPSSDAVRSPPADVEMTHVAPTTSVAKTEYVPVEIEEEAPTTTQIQNAPKEDEESWQPSIWSAAPEVISAPPTAPIGIMPAGPEARSFLRARTTRKTVKTQLSKNEASQGSDSDVASSSDQGGAPDTSAEDSKSGYVDATSEDFYAPAPIETDSNPESSNGKNLLPPPRSAVQVPASEVEKFGPRKCISTWRNSEGHCMLQTKCDDIDLSKVDVGMICVAADGAETRHTFGKDSFDSDEVFDTMVECNKCTALRKENTDKALTEKLQLLSEGIKDLEKGMESINDNVEKLNAKVFRKPSLAQTRKKITKPVNVYNDGEEGKEGNEEDEPEQQQREEISPTLQAQHEEEEHERQVQAVREEQKKKECDEGQEFNQGGDC